MLKRTIAAVQKWFSGASKSVTKGLGVGTLRRALSQGNPGGWASNHRAETDHFTGWNYVAARAVALQCSQAQVCVYQERAGARAKAYNEQDDQGEPLPKEHPLCRLLKRPHRKQSGASFRYELSLQLSLTGTALVWNVPNKLGKTVERYVIPTAIAQPMRPTRDFPNGYWRVQPEAAYGGMVDDGWTFGALGIFTGRDIPAEQVQVIRWPHPLYRDDGQSPLAAGALWTDTSEMVDQARWAHMQNGPNPSLVVKAPEGFQGDEVDLDRAATKFNERYGSPKNHGKALFVAGGDVVPLSQSAKDMDYQSAFLQLRDATLAIHGTPGVAAGVTDGGSYAAFYAALLQFTTLTVQPQLALIAEEETEQLAPQFGEGLTVEMLVKPIDDPQILENQLKTDLAGGIRKRDEYRQIRGLPLLGGKDGGELVGGAGAAMALGQSERTESTTGLPGMPRFSFGGLGGSQPQPSAEQPKPSDTPGLNGAQITAAVEMLANVQNGALASEAALLLLEQLNIPREIAQKILSAQLKLPDPEPIQIGAEQERPEEEKPPTLPKSDRFALNGHASRFKGYP